MKIPADGRHDYLGARELGTIRVTPAGEVVVGSHGTFTITWRAGEYGADVGGGIKVGLRRMADWGTPQFDDPAAPNYVSVACSAPSRLTVRYDPRGHIRPFRAVTIIDIVERPIYPGDEITVVLGDRSGGSPGIEVQSFPETVCDIAVFLDTLSSGQYERVPQVSGPLRVISGPAEKLELQAPSTVVAGRGFRVLVRGADRFGNPTPAEAADLTIDADPPVTLALETADGRAKWIEGVTIAKAGIRRLRLLSGDGAGDGAGDEGVLARSNPIRVRPEGADLSLYWGELQGQTASTVGSGTVEEYFRYARDFAGIDFCTHQGHDFMMSDAGWQEVKRETRRFNEPGRFATILGYEWSGATGAGGDRNVLYRGDDGPLLRCTSWQLNQSYPESEVPTASGMHEALRRHVTETGNRAMMLPHVGGRRADIDVHDAELEPVIEIASCHGIFEWRFREALERGLRIGVVASSDDSTARPGLALPTTPEMAIRGGLAAVYAGELTREAIFDALAARRCYATTGARILLDIAAGAHPMGADFTTTSPPNITGEVIGTAPLHLVTLHDGLNEVLRLTPNPPRRDPRRVRLTWTGARGPDRNRATNWDGGLTLSNGEIVSVEPLNMYAPKWGIVASDAGRVEWRSITAGQEVGVLLELDAPDDAVIAFAAGPASFEFRLGEVRARDLRIEAGGLEQAVAATTLHCDGDVTDARIDYTDPDIAPGAHAYWLRVVQSDFHRAWSSPIYVDFTPN